MDGFQSDQPIVQIVGDGIHFDGRSNDKFYNDAGTMVVSILRRKG